MDIKSHKNTVNLLAVDVKFICSPRCPIYSMVEITSLDGSKKQPTWCLVAKAIRACHSVLRFLSGARPPS